MPRLPPAPTLTPIARPCCASSSCTCPSAGTRGGCTSGQSQQPQTIPTTSGQAPVMPLRVSHPICYPCLHLKSQAGHCSGAALGETVSGETRSPLRQTGTNILLPLSDGHQHPTAPFRQHLILPHPHQTGTWHPSAPCTAPGPPPPPPDRQGTPTRPGPASQLWPSFPKPLLLLVGPAVSPTPGPLRPYCALIFRPTAWGVPTGSGGKPRS